MLGAYGFLRNPLRWRMQEGGVLRIFTKSVALENAERLSTSDFYQIPCLEECRDAEYCGFLPNPLCFIMLNIKPEHFITTLI